MKIGLKPPSKICNILRKINAGLRRRLRCTIETGCCQCSYKKELIVSRQPILVNLKSNTMKNTLQIYALLQNLQTFLQQKSSVLTYFLASWPKFIKTNGFFSENHSFWQHFAIFIFQDESMAPFPHYRSTPKLRPISAMKFYNRKNAEFFVILPIEIQ